MVARLKISAAYIMSNEHTPASSLPHVALDRVSMVYEREDQDLVAVAGADLEIRRGQFVSIIGPSGCGKSTLLRIIAGLQRASEGTVLIDGRPPREAQAAKAIGFVFQDPSLLPWRTVRANVGLPLSLNKRPGGWRPEELIDLVGLSRFRDYYPHQLSGGMQQRVAIARALVTAPPLLLMDEPFGALDEITRGAMRYELLRIWRSVEGESRTVIFVTHSITEAVLLSDRVVVMTPQPGRIAADLHIDLPRPRSEDIESDPAFLDYARQLKALLRARVPG